MPVAHYRIGTTMKSESVFKFKFKFQDFSYRKLRKLIKKKHKIEYSVDIIKVFKWKIFIVF